MVADKIAILDCILAFAKVAIENNYCKPNITQNNIINKEELSKAKYETQPTNLPGIHATKGNRLEEVLMDKCSGYIVTKQIKKKTAP